MAENCENGDGDIQEISQALNNFEVNSGECETDAGLSCLINWMKVSQNNLPVVAVADQRNYYMKNFRRGKCLIFNQKTFDPYTRLKPREGTDTDVTALVECFSDLGFDVQLENDLNKRDIEKLLQKVSDDKKYLAESDCFVCCIMTHGHEGALSAKDDRFSTDILFKNFKGDRCPKLAGKPKIFFIQACRGEKFGRGVDVIEQQLERADSLNVRTIPTEADFLIAYSTVSGYYSIREKTGTWFMQSLCAVLKEFGKTEDLLSMMTLVNNRVAYHYPNDNITRESLKKVKQTPLVTSTLTKKAYFPVNS